MAGRPPPRVPEDVTCAAFRADRHTAPIEPFATGFARTSFWGRRAGLVGTLGIGWGWGDCYLNGERSPTLVFIIANALHVFFFLLVFILPRVSLTAIYWTGNGKRNHGDA